MSRAKTCVRTPALGEIRVGNVTIAAVKKGEWPVEGDTKLS